MEKGPFWALFLAGANELLAISGWLLAKSLELKMGLGIVAFVAGVGGMVHAAQFAALIAPYDVDGWPVGSLTEIRRKSANMSPDPRAIRRLPPEQIANS